MEKYCGIMGTNKKKDRFPVDVFLNKKDKVYNNDVWLAADTYIIICRMNIMCR